MNGQKLEQITIDKMREMRAQGMRQKEIADGLGVSQATVSKHTCTDKAPKRARQELKKRDPIPRPHFKRKFCWTADKVYAQIQEARRQRRLYPCEHRQWRMNGAKDIVCLGYCELWGAQDKQDKKAPARSSTSDRRTAPNEAAS